ncbi:hypothetical protein [Paraburkholderia caballeronis]|uniref:hypothetical protein n=1 Tax=Paraburkholderia caballeronis TaxID=416943 RepID=UPI0010646318|nr:hypothetical protein [Paraburkholderia caballeronis]TDV08274.1 hypothetical protein C7408_11739 [Paraburkholderia caballeronis]TDV11966.1 hypothetical protein C7406_11839 [Paraburkholderia caballeronis]TDV22587.1 hypothetical protein C7404_11739 [Paraburkholderia caballeronis]TDV35248.1 hypothetical protein C7405_106282 [Paraburkholderia caballeronis]
MMHTIPRVVLRAAGVLAAASLVWAGAANAQTAAPQTAATAQPAPPVDPTFSAWSLAQLCQQQGDNVAQGQCVGAVRGIIHGYQYGVLFLGQRAAPPAGEMQRVSLCLRDVPVATIVQEFVTDAGQVSPDALKATPAEVALLGSVHSRHACT